MVALPFDKAKVVRRSSVNREIARLNSARIHRVAKVDNEVRRLSVTTLPQAGSAVVTAKPTRSLSVKASCWDVPLMATRPSTHEVTCLVAIAEP